jgi:hypothetical protein
MPHTCGKLPSGSALRFGCLFTSLLLSCVTLPATKGVAVVHMLQRLLSLNCHVLPARHAAAAAEVTVTAVARCLVHAG